MKHLTEQPLVSWWLTAWLVCAEESLRLMTADGVRHYFRTWPANPYRTKRSKEGD